MRYFYNATIENIKRRDIEPWHTIISEPTLEDTLTHVARYMTRVLGISDISIENRCNGIEDNTEYHMYIIKSTFTRHLITIERPLI